MFYGRSNNTNRSHVPMDMDYIFTLNADAADISALFTAQIQDPKTLAYIGQSSGPYAQNPYGANGGALGITMKINPLELQNLI